MMLSRAMTTLLPYLVVATTFMGKSGVVDTTIPGRM
jgi:hypothetical protein